MGSICAVSFAFSHGNARPQGHLNVARENEIKRKKKLLKVNGRSVKLSEMNNRKETKLKKERKILRLCLYEDLKRKICIIILLISNPMKE